MKSNFLNLVMPIAVIAVGLAGALSTNAMEKSSSKAPTVTAYRHVIAPIPCEEEEQLCSNEGLNVCTSDIDGANLYEKSASGCPNLLFRTQ